MAVTLSIAITQVSQDIAANKSTVKVDVKVSWTGGSYNALVNSAGSPQAHGAVRIGSSSYTFRSTFNTGQTTSGSQTVFTKTVTIAHDSDGSKTLSCYAEFVTGVSSGTITASASKTLTKIPRISDFTVGSGALGSSVTITVSPQTTSAKHTITYLCNGETGTICTKSSSKSITFTPPISLASKNTTGTSVMVTYTLYTYIDDTEIGSTFLYVHHNIPASIAPTCKVAVSDATNYKTLVGAYVQGLSKFAVTVTGTPSYGSPIASYSTTANGGTYTSATFTTGVLKTSGTLSVTGKVTDKRGRSGSNTVSGITVLPYARPVINQLVARRCDVDGTDNTAGSYVKVLFDTGVSSLNSKNTATYTIEYKKVSETTYTKIELSEYKDVLSVEGGSHIFEATAASAYDVRLTVKDIANATALAMSVPTGTKFMSWRKGGRGMAFGKPCERDDAFEVGWRMYSTHGELVTSAYELLDGTDLDDIMDEGYYVIPNTAVSATIVNKPPWAVEQNTATAHLEIGRMGESIQKFQRYSICAKTYQMVFQRMYYGNVWSDWLVLSGCSTWRNLTIASGFEVYGSGYTPRYRINGNLVTVTGGVKPTAIVTSSTTDVKILGTISEPFRPSTHAVFVCQGSGINRWALTIKTDGNLYVSRYGTNTYVDIPVGAWLPFTVTYSI